MTASTVSRTPRPLVLRALVVVLLVIGAIVGTVVLGFVAFALAALWGVLVPFAVPAGLVAGIVLRTVLVLRRRRAARDADRPPTRAEDAAFRGAALEQRIDRWLAVHLLVLAGIGAVFALGAAVSQTLAVPGSLDAVLQLSGVFAMGAAVQLLVAIAAAVTVAVRQVLDRDLLRGEAVALATGAPSAAWIRSTRVLSWTAAALWAVVAVVLIVVAAPSFLGG